jgi:hypothetical protein
MQCKWADNKSYVQSLRQKEIIMHEEIKSVYEQWKNALIKTDVTTLEKLYTDNFSWTNHMGITSNKPENLFKAKSGNVQYISWFDKDMEINIINDNAVVKTEGVLKMLVYEQSISIVRSVIATFQFSGGRWLLAEIEERKNVV